MKKICVLMSLVLLLVSCVPAMAEDTAMYVSISDPVVFMDDQTTASFEGLSLMLAFAQAEDVSQLILNVLGGDTSALSAVMQYDPEKLAVAVSGMSSVYGLTAEELSQLIAPLMDELAGLMEELPLDQLMGMSEASSDMMDSMDVQIGEAEEVTYDFGSGEVAATYTPCTIDMTEAVKQAFLSSTPAANMTEEDIPADFAAYVEMGEYATEDEYTRHVEGTFTMVAEGDSLKIGFQFNMDAGNYTCEAILGRPGEDPQTLLTASGLYNGTDFTMDLDLSYDDEGLKASVAYMTAVGEGFDTFNLSLAPIGSEQVLTVNASWPCEGVKGETNVELSMAEYGETQTIRLKFADADVLPEGADMCKVCTFSFVQEGSEVGLSFVVTAGSTAYDMAANLIPTDGMVSLLSMDEEAQAAAMDELSTVVVNALNTLMGKVPALGEILMGEMAEPEMEAE